MRRHASPLSPRRPRRSAKQPSYRETSTDSESDQPSPSNLRRSQRYRRQSETSRPSTPTSPSQNLELVDSTWESPRPKKKQRVVRSKPSPKKPAKSNAAVQTPFESTGIIPEWTSLPFEVLVDVFKFASQPLYDEYFRPNSSIQWLLDVSTLCKAFREPVLTALYHSPPLMPLSRSFRLLDFLSSDTPHWPLDVRRKIQRLELDVINVLGTKGGGLSRGYFDITALIAQIPQLKELHLYNTHDITMMPLPAAMRTPWRYPVDMFHVMNLGNFRLRSFEWNGLFFRRATDDDDTGARLNRVGPAVHLEQMSEIHKSPCLQHLRDLILVDFFRAKPYLEGDQSMEAIVGSSLGDLPSLRRLKFKNCPLVNGSLLTHLPKDLEALHFENCDNLDSEDLRTFLASHGAHLKRLHLEHNSSLALSFITGLETSCPKLEELKYDLRLFSTSVVINDSEPRFDDLLLAHEVPTWPKTIQVLEFNQLRKWDQEAAEIFFGSLLGNAQNLGDLRRLVIKAIVNIGWRDRASFREKWIGRLKRVFLRHVSAPNPTRMSLALSRKVKENLQRSLEEKAAEQSDKRRSHRIAKLEDEALKLPYSSAGSQQSSSSSQSTRRGSTAEDIFIQGMCNVVDVRIDNLRPAQSQFDEDDFLDDEKSGDEDWNGDKSDPVPTYSW